MEFDRDQQEAIDYASHAKFAMITGGAGTGKTTIIKEIAGQVKQPELCAFAGKAAARLREATGFEASTIHRMLMSNGDIFMRRSLYGSSVIVDEASMVSADLMAEIMKRRPDRLILVGDPAQLPPVGKGQPFHDILGIFPKHVKTLTTCYRNTEAVYKAASRIRRGEFPGLHDKTPNERWDLQSTGPALDTQRNLLEMIRNGFIDFEQDIILCPRNGDSADQPCTVKGLNQAIREIVNPPRGDERIIIGDRVINTKNFAEQDVWNGTTGTVHSIDDDGQIWVHLDIPAIDHAETKDPTNPVYRDMVLFDKEMKKHLELAYALTVHKAQGSQYRRVVFIALERDSFALLDRSLIYTAVTRAKEHCIVMGQSRALHSGISTIKQKTTVLQELALSN